MRAMHRVRVTLKGKVVDERDLDRPLTIGRKAPSDIVVADDIDVSKRHLRVAPDGDRVLVADLGSTNGTSIDGGAKLVPNADTPLAPGQRLVIGSSLVELVAASIPEVKPEPSAVFASTEKTVRVGDGAVQSILVNVARFKSAQPRLVVAAEHDRRVVAIEEMDVVVGRDPQQSKIVVQHQSVSAKHARLRFENGRFFVEDQKSVNGTFVDGVPATAATPLASEQSVTFGTVDCLFVQNPAEAGSGGVQEDPHAEALCDHAVRLGKATNQQAKEVLAEHRASGTSLGQLFVQRGILGPKEWSEIYRQRQIIGGMAELAAKGGMSLSKVVGIVVVLVVIAVLMTVLILKR
jgi:pSer/pThr/pTyr-binding forkhead associated (FHA) protein